MADRYVIVRYDITQGEAFGREIVAFADLEEAKRAFEAGRAAGTYVDEGSYWSGATAYELLRHSDAGYTTLDGGIPGPYGLLGPPAFSSSQVGDSGSSIPAGG
jgi:hypothetical protein